MPPSTAPSMLPPSPPAAAASAEHAAHAAAVEGADVVLRVLDRLRRRAGRRAARSCSACSRVGGLQLLRLHERGAGFGQPRAGLRADGAATRGDVVLGRRDLRLRLQDHAGRPSAARAAPGPRHPARPARRRRSARSRPRGSGASTSGRRAVPARFARAASICWRVAAIAAATRPSASGRADAARDVLLELGDQRGRAPLAVGEVAAELVDRVLEQHGLADGLFGGADADGGLAALAGADRGLGGGELLVGERDPLARLVRGCRRPSRAPRAHSAAASVCRRASAPSRDAAAFARCSCTRASASGAFCSSLRSSSNAAAFSSSPAFASSHSAMIWAFHARDLLLGVRRSRHRAAAAG